MKITSIFGWGLFGFVLLAGLSILLVGPWIEHDLAKRNRTDLTAAGQGWATVAMNGRDAILSGQAPDADSLKTAIDVVSNVWGVGDVKNEAAEP